MLIIGILLALGSAVSESLVDVARKKTTKSFDALSAAFALHALTFVLAFPVTLAVAGHAVPTSSEFWMSLAVSAALNSVAMYLYMSALATQEMGVVLPLVTLSPVFLLVTSPLIVHEWPSWLGVAGVVVTTAGTYGLKFEDRRDGFWKPLQNLWSNTSNRKMLFVAFLWAISAPFDKRATLVGGPLWYMTLIDACLACIYLPFMFRHGRWRKLLSRRGLHLLPLGVTNAIRAGCQFSAMALLLVPYAIGIKRLSILFGIVWGRLFFNEKQTTQRLVAASVMIAGTIIILLASAGGF